MFKKIVFVVSMALISQIASAVELQCEGSCDSAYRDYSRNNYDSASNESAKQCFIVTYLYGESKEVSKRCEHLAANQGFQDSGISFESKNKYVCFGCD